MINADIIKVDNKEYIKVWFKSHPIANEKMKTVTNAKRNPLSGYWSIPIENKNEFVKKLKDHLIVWHTNAEIRGGGMDEKYIDSKPRRMYTVEYDEDGVVVSSTGWKVPPIAEYQVKGFLALWKEDFLILADEQGLGKTWMMATALEAKKRDGLANKGVVIAKASLLYNWKDEIERFTNLKAVVVEGSSQARNHFYAYLMQKNVDFDVIIVSYETFRNDRGNFQLIHHHRTLDYMVLDEAQKISNPTSKIGTVIHYLDVPYKYLLTGTPLPNTPLQAYNYFKLGGFIEMNWWQFQKHHAIFGGYNNKEIIGYQNMREIQRLFEDHMLRRLKKDKLKELPDVMFRDIRVEMTKEQKKLYNGVLKGILEDLKESSIQTVPATLAKLMRLQQITDSPALIDATGDSAKLIALDELLESLIEENNSKVIVFSRFRTMIEIFMKRYAKYGYVTIHGGVSAEDRHKNVKAFQEDPNVKLFLGCAPACREGITLTASSDVIFFDMEWNWANYSQAYSRAHRIGQKNYVMVYNLMCKDTIDEHVRAVVHTKKNISETILDVKIDNSNALIAKKLIESMVGKTA